ncbi:putative n-acetyltransferase p20 [Fusarium flagelliforme]|uniref:Putative n-acetyltransferase p20 n=2 Tax=Fusarium flagelliforme TaxID=2675880 RepID=A0A395MA14_9HYPO|nr:putative n-acetyltransferase p20 [Fusarium flagelliforme]
MSPETILQLESCAVRAYKEGDAESLAKAANNPKIARYMRNTFPHPYEIPDAKKWISIANTPPLHDFAICSPDSSIVIGGIGLKARDDIHYRTMEIGYWICEDYWYRGIATEVVRAFSDWAFDNFGHLVRLEAEVFEGNLASCRVLEKSGFELEGRKRAAVEKMGIVMDTSTYSKIRQGR